MMAGIYNGTEPWAYEIERLREENKRLRDVIENAHTGIEEGWIGWTGKMLEEEIRSWKGEGGSE